MSSIIQSSRMGYNKFWDELKSGKIDNPQLIEFIKNNNLRRSEYSVIGAYTGRASRIINERIRGGHQMKEKEQKFKSELILALNNIPSLDNVILYRDEIYDDIHEFLNGKKEGEVLKLDYFISTYQDNRINPKNALQIEIQTKSKNSKAKDISLIGKKTEKEALILCETEFKILKIDIEKNWIKLVEI